MNGELHEAPRSVNSVKKGTVGILWVVYFCPLPPLNFANIVQGDLIDKCFFLVCSWKTLKTIPRPYILKKKYFAPLQLSRIEPYFSFWTVDECRPF